MKNRVSLCAQLGLTETEIAMLLGTTRSRWSMYERNRGSLPPDASKKLAELLSLMSSEVSKEKDLIVMPDLYKKKLALLVADYKLKSHLLSRKIAHAEEKLGKQKHLYAKINELKNCKNEKSALAQKFESILSHRFSGEKEVAAEMKIFMLQTKLESLELEVKRIEEKLNGLK